MSVLDQILNFIAQINPFLDLFNALLLFLGFFGINI